MENENHDAYFYSAAFILTLLWQAFSFPALQYNYNNIYLLQLGCYPVSSLRMVTLPCPWHCNQSAKFPETGSQYVAWWNPQCKQLSFVLYWRWTSFEPENDDDGISCQISLFISTVLQWNNPVSIYWPRQWTAFIIIIWIKGSKQDQFRSWSLYVVGLRGYSKCIFSFTKTHSLRNLMGAIASNSKRQDPK